MAEVMSPPHHPLSTTLVSTAYPSKLDANPTHFLLPLICQLFISLHSQILVRASYTPVQQQVESKKRHHERARQVRFYVISLPFK